MAMTRAEHLAWAKQRAIEELEAGDLNSAFASMLSDLGKHPELVSSQALARDLGGPLLVSGHLSTPQKMREWIEGFN